MSNVNVLLRQGVFETNSSSTHSLSISPTEAHLYDTIYTDDNGVVKVYLSTFGWEQERYNDASTKLAYVWIYIRDWMSGETQSKAKDILEDVVFSHTGGNSFEVIDAGDSWHKEGYIDHQSVEGGALDYLFEDGGKTLKDFIFSPNSELETDNDNH